MAKIPRTREKDTWPSRRELIELVQHQDELLGQQNAELAELRAAAQKSEPLPWEHHPSRPSHEGLACL